MSDVNAPAKWTCQTLRFDDKGGPGASITDQNPVTVGEKFLLVCEGGGVELNQAKLSLELPKKARYALRILETRGLEAGRGEFVVTTWVGQSVSFPTLILTDGSNRVDLGPLAINTKSSIPEEKQKEPQPYDPYGPVKLGLPVTVWILIAIVLCLIGAWAAWLASRLLKRKRLKTLLAKNQIALTPFNQFNKDLRRIVRAGSGDLPASIKDLRESFRWYLTRDLVIPATTESTPRILKEIGRKHPKILKSQKRDLSLALNELDKAATSPESTSETDLVQLTDLCRTLADRIQRLKEA